MKITNFTVLNEDVSPEQINIDSLIVKNILNTSLWFDDVLNEEVRDQALAIGEDFFEFCTKDLKNKVEIVDMVFTGGLANYMWSKHSDFDIHVIVKYLDINDDTELVSNYFRDKATLYSLNNEYEICGFEVETNMNDVVKFRKNSGVYSLIDNKWIQKPDPENIEIDYKYVKDKTASIINKIDHTECKLEDLKKIKKKISNMRDVALSEDGEFSNDNLVFKLLRRSGYIEKLKSNIEKLAKTNKLQSFR